MIKYSFLSLCLFLTTQSYASELTYWVIKQDTNLDGILDSNSEVRHLSMNIKQSEFIVQFKGETDVVTGWFNKNNTQVLNFSRRGNQDTHVYAGIKFENSYKGSWFGTTGSFGDFELEKSSIYTSCLDALNDGQESDGTYKIDPDGINGLEPFDAYCDMTTDGGGWTLVGSYPKSSPGGIKRISEYGNVPELQPNAINGPSKLWLYKGDVINFKDIREQVACSDDYCRSGNSVYGFSVPSSDIQKVRYSWGYLDRVENMPYSEDMPNCYTENNLLSSPANGCTIYNSSPTTDTVIGWQTDLFGTIYCWAARGTYAPHLKGSAQCSGAGESNGTRWALLWFR